MTFTQDTLTLTKKLKQIIQEHYKYMPHRHLAEKVRTQIIPILISLFFQGNQQYNSKTMSNKIMTENNGYIVNEVKSRLRQSHKFKTNKSGKENFQSDDVKGYNERLLKVGINLEEFIKNNEQSTIQDIILKTLSLCKLINSIQKLSKKKENTSQIFKIYSSGIQNRKKQIRWLQKYTKITKIRYSLHKFHQNLYINRNKKQTCKALHKLYIIKLYNYYNKFINNLPHIVSGKPQSSLESISNTKQNAYRSLMLKSGLNKMQSIYGRRLRQALKKIDKYNISNNHWMIKCIRIIAYRTPANLQTSFWRLKNFMNNQANPKEKDKQEIFSQNNISFGQQTFRKKPQNNLSFRQNNTQNILKAEQIFTKNQKTQILCELLELVYRQRYFSFIIEAFSAIQFHAYSTSKQSNGNYQENNYS